MPIHVNFQLVLTGKTFVAHSAGKGAFTGVRPENTQVSKIGSAEDHCKNPNIQNEEEYGFCSQVIRLAVASIVAPGKINDYVYAWFDKCERTYEEKVICLYRSTNRNSLYKQKM